MTHFENGEVVAVSWPPEPVETVDDLLLALGSLPSPQNRQRLMQFALRLALQRLDEFKWTPPESIRQEAERTGKSRSAVQRSRAKERDK